MDYRTRSRITTLAVAVVTCLTGMTFTGLPVVTAHAAVPAHPACRVSRLAVTAGATTTNTTYAQTAPTGAVTGFASEAVPLYFYNTGPTCHLLMGAPSVRAVKSTTKIGAIGPSDVSIPVGADNENRMLVTHHQRLEALFVVVRPNVTMNGPCDPSTTTGLLVGGYATPISSAHFIVRRLRSVCFDTGVGRNNVNTGVVWLSRK